MELYLTAARSEDSTINSSSGNGGGGMALVAIADAFRSGEASPSGKPDIERAIGIYREAEGRGCARASVRLGECARFVFIFILRFLCFFLIAVAVIREGVLGNKDLALAFRYFETAAEMNDMEGMRELARCLLEGEGCEVDFVRAQLLLDKLAEQGTF